MIAAAVVTQKWVWRDSRNAAVTQQNGFTAVEFPSPCSFRCLFLLLLLSLPPRSFLCAVRPVPCAPGLVTGCSLIVALCSSGKSLLFLCARNPHGTRLPVAYCSTSSNHGLGPGPGPGP